MHRESGASITVRPARALQIGDSSNSSRPCGHRIRVRSRRPSFLWMTSAVTHGAQARRSIVVITGAGHGRETTTRPFQMTNGRTADDGGNGAHSIAIAHPGLTPICSRASPARQRVDDRRTHTHVIGVARPARVRSRQPRKRFPPPITTAGLHAKFWTATIPAQSGLRRRGRSECLLAHEASRKAEGYEAVGGAAYRSIYQRRTGVRPASRGFAGLKRTKRGTAMFRPSSRPTPARLSVVTFGRGGG